MRTTSHRLSLALSAFAAALLAAGCGPAASDTVPDGAGPKTPAPDAGIQEPEAGPPIVPQCVEAEAVTRQGAVAVYAGPPETLGGSAVLAKDGGGTIRVPFQLAEAKPIRVWARVRALTWAHNELSVGLDGVDTRDVATWDIPLTPVLRWMEVTPRGLGTAYRPESAPWPGWVAAGNHTLVFSGREPDVEIDAICVRSPGDVPPERFAEPPVRSTTLELSQFGAAGDGFQDDTAALQAALDALEPGGALHLPEGRYRITGELTLATSDVTLRGDGPRSVIFADLPVAVADPTLPRRGLAIVGQQESGATPLLRDALLLERAILVGASAPFAAGDTIQVRCDDWGPPAPYYPGPFFRNRVNYARVTAVRAAASGKELVLDRPLLSEFLRARNAKVERYAPLRGVVLENLRFEGTSRPLPEDNPDIDLVGALRCERCFFADLSFRFARKSNLDLFRNFESQVLRADVADVVDTGGGGHGYGVTMNRSQGLVIRDSHFFGVLRHAVPISWGSREGFVFNNRFDRGVPHTNLIASVDLHGQDDYANLVEANQIVGGQPGIIVGGGGTSHGNDGPWNVIRGNYLEGTTDGIAVYKSTYDTIIERNVIRRPGYYGLRVDSGSHRAFLRGNVVEGYTGAGVAIADSNDAEVRLNTLVPGAGPAIRVHNSVNYVIAGNSLGGGAIDQPGTGTVVDNQ